MADTVVLTKSGPRLIDVYRDTNELVILVNGPGMLVEKLELMTNRSAVDGAHIDFFRTVASGLQATVACAHEPLRRATIDIEPHRLGGELSIEVGPPSMYQSELRLRTLDARTLRELIDAALLQPAHALAATEPVIAALVVARASGHHEHHASANAALRRAGEPPGRVHNHGEQ